MNQHIRLVTLFLSFSLSCAIFVGYAGAQSNPAFPIQLRVLNAAAQPRNNEVVAFGIPLEENRGLISTGQLSIVDSNNAPVAAQFKVLSRWGDLVSSTRPIKWLKVTFLANVAAVSAGQTQAESNYSIVSNPAGTSTGSIAISQTNNFFLISTRAGNHFEISKTIGNSFSVFHKVILDGNTLVDLSANSVDGLEVYDSNGLAAPSIIHRCGY